MNIFESIITSGQNLDKKTTRKCKCNKSLHEDKDDDNTEVIDARDDVVVVEPEEEEEIDDAVVVVDPDISMDDLVDNLENLQDILDATVGNEVATSDEYVDDHIYACPVCGNNFFSEEPMEDGEACPVCGDTPDGYVLVGTVEDPEEAAEEIEAQTDAEEAEDAIDDVADAVDAAREEIDDLQDDEEDEIEDLEVEESKEAPIKKRLTRATRATRETPKDLTLDESKLNALMTDYASKTYKGVKCMEVKKVTLIGSNLVCECAITTTSGRKHRATIKFEGFTTSKSINKTKGKLECKAIATTSKYPFLLESKIVKGQIIPVTFRYNYAVSEGKRVHGASMIRKGEKVMAEKKFESIILGSQKKSLKESRNPRVKKLREGAKETSDQLVYAFYKGSRTAADELANPEDAYPDEVREAIRAGVDALNATPDEVVFRTTDQLWFHQDFKLEDVIESIVKNGTSIFANDIYAVYKGKFRDLPIIVIHYLLDDEPYMPELVMFVGDNEYAEKETARQRAAKEAEAEVDESKVRSSRAKRSLREDATAEVADMFLRAMPYSRTGLGTADKALRITDDIYRDAVKAAVKALGAAAEDVVARDIEDDARSKYLSKMNQIAQDVRDSGRTILDNEGFTVITGSVNGVKVVIADPKDDDPYAPTSIFFIGEDDRGQRMLGDEDIKFEKKSHARSQR